MSVMKTGRINDARTRSTGGRLWRALPWIVSLCAPTSAQVTQRVSVDSGGAQGNEGSSRPTISADGRFVAFASRASNLVPGDTNLAVDVFVRDRQSGTTERVSVGPGGVQGELGGDEPFLSADGRVVAFTSFSTTLVSSDTNGTFDVFVRDLVSGTTELASVDSNGVQANAGSARGRVSADGRFVAFMSGATNLVPLDTNGRTDVFVRDRLNGTTERVSVATIGTQADDDCGEPWISSDGRFVLFQSNSSLLVPGDANGTTDLFVRDRQLGTTQRVSVASSGAEANGQSYSATISAGGRFVVFLSFASNLVPADTNGMADFFVRDLASSTTERLALPDGAALGNIYPYYPVVSDDGRHVAFYTGGGGLAPGDVPGVYNVYLHDRRTGTNEIVSVDPYGQAAIRDSTQPAISPDVRYVAFESSSNDLAPGDLAGYEDVFVRDRFGEPAFVSLCIPGVAGTATCPCSNPPSAPDRGCDNSAATGGAILSASGGTFLSSDTLLLRATGLKFATTCVLLQSANPPNSGRVYGQGILCLAGPVRRLYTKPAHAGSLLVPDYENDGDPRITLRSAVLGDAILAGQTRQYEVVYRDPVVLGGCAATSTINSTQAGRVTWSP